MANLKDVIYLSKADYQTLYSTGTVTIDGTTLTYDANNLYIVPEEQPNIPTKVSQLENDAMYTQTIEAVSMTGYDQLAYIETNGTQIIATTIVPNQNTGFELDFLSSLAPTASNAPQIINAGGRGTQNRFAVSIYKASGLDGEVMIKTASNNAKIVVNNRQILKYINDGVNKTLTYTDGSTVSVEASGEWTAKDSGGNNAPLILFGLKSGNTYDRLFSGRLYRLKIYNLDELAYDFVPARRKSDDEIGLYEVVNGVFYVNDATGGDAFTYGVPDTRIKVSQLIMDKNLGSDNNFTNAYKNKIDTANNILTNGLSSDGTYVLKATVSDGQVTYSWVAENV